MSEGRVDDENTPTKANVGAPRAWRGLGGFDPTGGGAVNAASSDGRIIIRPPSAEAAREIEEAARAHEEMHWENREALMLAVHEALARGVAAGTGPWVPGHPASEKRREELRRAGLEERAGGIGTVWVRPADDETLKPREALFVVPAERDRNGGRSG